MVRKCINGAKNGFAWGKFLQKGDIWFGLKGWAVYRDKKREERHYTLGEWYMQNQSYYEYEVLGNAEKFLVG